MNADAGDPASTRITKNSLEWARCEEKIIPHVGRIIQGETTEHEQITSSNALRDVVADYDVTEWSLLMQLESYLCSAEVRIRIFERAADLRNEHPLGMLFIRPVYSMLCQVSRTLHAMYSQLRLCHPRRSSFINTPLWHLLCSTFTRHASEMYPADADMMAESSQFKLMLFVRDAFGNLAPESLQFLSFVRSEETLPAWWYGRLRYDPPSFDPPRDLVRVVLKCSGYLTLFFPGIAP